jgi:hypothetical protein
MRSQLTTAPPSYPKSTYAAEGMEPQAAEGMEPLASWSSRGKNRCMIASHAGPRRFQSKAMLAALQSSAEMIKSSSAGKRKDT